MKILSALFLSFLMFSSVCGQIDKNNKPFKDEFSGIEISRLSYQIQKASQSATSSQYTNPLFQDLRKYRLDSVVTESYDMEGSHSPSVKSEYKYNGNGKPTTILDYYWDSNYWSVVSKTEYTYFDGNNYMLVSDYNWYDTIWKIYTKSDYYFDDQDNQTLRIDSIYSYLSNRWMIARKTEEEYDANGNNVLYQSTCYQNEQVKSQLEYQYSYDNLDRLMLAIVSQTHIDPNELELTFKLEYNYDLNDYQTNIMISSWQTDSSDWVPIRKEDYIYNSTGQMISEIVNTYLSYSNDWEYHSKYDYTYDANNNPEIGLSYYWDNLYNQWEMESKKEHSYDATKTISEVNVPSMDVYKQDYPEYIVNAPVHYIYSEVGIGDLETVYANTYYYSETNLGVSEVTDADISIYPNPATDRLYVSDTHYNGAVKCIVYNSFGQIAIQEQEFNNNIDIRALKTGLYVLEIRDEKSKIRLKFIKR